MVLDTLHFSSGYDVKNLYYIIMEGFSMIRFALAPHSLCLCVCDVCACVCLFVRSAMQKHLTAHKQDDESSHAYTQNER